MKKRHKETRGDRELCVVNCTSGPHRPNNVQVMAEKMRPSECVVHRKEMVAGMTLAALTAIAVWPLRRGQTAATVSARASLADRPVAEAQYYLVREALRLRGVAAR